MVRGLGVWDNDGKKDGHFEDSKPQQSQVRMWEMNEPKTQYELPTQVLCHYVIIKECMNAASESFLDGKERHELTEKIKQSLC